MIFVRVKATLLLRTNTKHTHVRRKSIAFARTKIIAPLRKNLHLKEGTSWTWLLLFSCRQIKFQL